MKFFIIVLIPFSLLSQEETKNCRFTVGASIQLSNYNFYESVYSGKDQTNYIYERNKLGYSFDIKFNYQNRFVISSFENGLNFAPVPAYSAYQIQFKQAVNFNFRDVSLNNFIGPFVSYGYLIGFDEETKSIFNVGIIYSTKNFQYEIGKIFRHKYDNYFTEFRYGYFISFGYRIPLKRELKN